MNTEKLTPLEFCIIVTWMHGWTINKIFLSLAKRHGKSEHAVRGIINKIPQRRQSMSRSDRQHFLDELKANRIDDGMLPVDYFVSKSLASDQKQKAVVPVERKAKAKPEKIPEPDPKTRAGRREIKRRKEEAEKKKQKSADEQLRREAGFAPRGVESAPLEFLYNEKLLSNSEDGGKGEPKEKTNNAMRRYEAGVRLRSMMESIYGSGVKSPDYEGAGGGGGGAGVVIHAVVAENMKNIHSIRSLMVSEWFHMLEQLLIHGMFVWQIPSKNGASIVLTEIRQALDKVSLFLGTMPAEDGDVDVPKRADRGAVRQSTMMARDAIAKAQRHAR